MLSKRDCWLMLTKVKTLLNKLRYFVVAWELSKLYNVARNLQLFGNNVSHIFSLINFYWFQVMGSDAIKCFYILITFIAI